MASTFLEKQRYLMLVDGLRNSLFITLGALAIGVVIGKYRDGDRKTRQQMKQVLERFN